jgi:hypothetical protein
MWKPDKCQREPKPPLSVPKGSPPVEEIVFHKWRVLVFFLLPVPLMAQTIVPTPETPNNDRKSPFINPQATAPPTPLTSPDDVAPWEPSKDLSHQAANNTAAKQGGVQHSRTMPPTQAH